MTTAVIGGSRRKRQKNRRKVVLISVAVLVVVGLLGLFIKLLTSGGVVKKTVPADVVQLHIITPPPPPPPPPPKDEPVKVKEDPQPVPEPQQAAPPKTESPPSPQLAADSDGAGDLSGKAGGTPYVGDGVVGGAPASTGKGGTYRAFVVSEFRRALLANERLRTAHFKRVAVRVTVSGDGRVEQVELLESTGKPEIDRLITGLLQGVGKVSNPPADGQPKTYAWQISPES